MILKTSFYWTFNMLQWLPQEGENMIYYTGDIHGRPQGLQEYFEKHKPSADDILVILGDVGANFYMQAASSSATRPSQSLSSRKTFFRLSPSSLHKHFLPFEATTQFSEVTACLP